MKASASAGERHQPIFIVGAPRTGSTILYQSLTNCFDVLYIDNLVCRWNQAMFFGFKRSKAKFGGSPHNVFSAEHGDTTRSGMHAPSECGAFWYRWIPKNQHFVNDSDVTVPMVRDLRLEVLAVQNHFNRPMMFKNLNVGQRLRLIHAAFPGARIIFVRRRHSPTVRSIQKARTDLGIRENEWWSTKPRSFESLLALPELEMIDNQILTIESQIAEDLSRFPSEQWREIQFDDFGPKLIHDLGDWLGLASRRGGNIPEFRPDDASDPEDDT